MTAHRPPGRYDALRLALTAAIVAFVMVFVGSLVVMNVQKSLRSPPAVTAPGKP